MLKLKTTVAVCLALAVIGSIIACSSQPAKSGNDAKTQLQPRRSRHDCQSGGHRTDTLCQPACQSRRSGAGS